MGLSCPRLLSVCLHFLLIIRPLQMACYPTVVFQFSHQSLAVEITNRRVNPSLSLGVLSQCETLAVVTWLERGLGFMMVTFKTHVLTQK